MVHNRLDSRYNKGRTVFAELFEGGLDLLLRIGVNRTRSFVKKDDVWLLQDCSSDGYSLQFAAGEFPGNY